MFTPEDKVVVTPNSDTPYSFIWMLGSSDPFCTHTEPARFLVVLKGWCSGVPTVPVTQAKLPSGALFSFFWEGNQPKQDALFSHGHWASEQVNECTSLGSVGWTDPLPTCPQIGKPKEAILLGWMLGLHRGLQTCVISHAMDPK